MAKPKWRKGVPLETEAQERLRALVRERGEREVARLLDIGITSVVRAAAGLGLRRGTSRVIEIGIDALAPLTRAA